MRNITKLATTAVLIPMLILATGCGVNGRQETLATPPAIGTPGIPVNVRVSLDKDYTNTRAHFSVSRLVWNILFIPLLLPWYHTNAFIIIDDGAEAKPLIIQQIKWGTPQTNNINNFWFIGHKEVTYKVSVECKGMKKGSWEVGSFTLDSKVPRKLVANLTGAEGGQLEIKPMPSSNAQQEGTEEDATPTSPKPKKVTKPVKIQQDDGEEDAAPAPPPKPRKTPKATKVQPDDEEDAAPPLPKPKKAPKAPVIQPDDSE
jgi:hypothetical protein